MNETYKNNGLIAEFMGAVWKQDDYGDWGYYCGNFPHYNHMQSKGALEYHSSWNWLMPVVKKIADLLLNKDWEDLQEAAKRWKPIANELQNVSKDNIYFCVVKFIEWYNKTLRSDG